MTIDTDLARLTAGLDRDEAIARAALAKFEPVDLEDWCWGPGPWGYGNRAGTRMLMGRDEWSDHINRQGPKATLDRVEAIRKVLARHHPETVSGVVVHLGDPGRGAVQVCAGCGNRGNGFGYTAWPCPDIQDLAAIYTIEEA